MDTLVLEQYVLGPDHDFLRGWAVHDLIVNGRSLTDLWCDATDDAAQAMPNHDVRRYWGTEEHPAENLTRNGTVPIIVCSCGDFLCGGATVRVTMGDEIVTWDDFRTANARERVPGLGPFQFERKAYLTALGAT